MLGKTRPGYRRKCRYAGRGCTCFYFPGGYRAASKVVRRWIARRMEERAWKRDRDL